MFDPGFYTDISFLDYLEDDAVNNSGLKLFSQSPAKFRFWQNHERPGTPSQIEGSALHTAILEPAAFTERYGKGPAPRAGSKDRASWDQANPKAQALSPAAWNNVEGMAKAFEHTSCTIAKDLLTEGTPELSIFFDDPTTGLRCKIRPDWLRNDDIVCDLKSTQAGSPQGFLREVKRWGYDRQAAWYERGLNAAYKAANVNRYMKAFIFIIVENFSPYETAVYALSENILEEARRQIDVDLEGYAKCVSTNTWPGFANEIVILGEDN